MAGPFTDAVLELQGDEGSPRALVKRAQAAYRERYAEIRAKHARGESGLDVQHALSDLADDILAGLIHGVWRHTEKRPLERSRIALCALGGYGRRELAPQSDLDACLLYSGRLDKRIRELDEFFVTCLWDIGFRSAFATRSVKEALELTRNDVSTFTCFREGRFITGAQNTYAKLQLGLHDRRAERRAHEYAPRKLAARRGNLPLSLRDPFAQEPNIKEGAGGLRDYHTALWLFSFQFDIDSLDEAASRDIITSDEQLTIVEAIDFISRIRNELHFRSGRNDDVLSLENQRETARAFGYEDDIEAFMSDYYNAARMIRHLLRIAAKDGDDPAEEKAVEGIYVSDGYLYLANADAGWYAHNPVRLMETVWRCARHGVKLSRPVERAVRANLDLVNDEFRSNDLVRRFFVAMCNRPMDAGLALREAARCGLLGRYLPEYAAVCDVLRYEDFHSYPTDEHTLRAIEAIARLAYGESPVERCLREALENLSDPYVLIMALLFHDLGKVEGEVHIEASERITHDICRRINMPEEDEERIAFLVRHHILMTTISQYRDIDDDNIVQQFADTIQNEQRLRALFLLSYADLSAVGPGVWNEWKGALLMRLYLRTVRKLLGRAESAEDEYWKSPKAEQVVQLASPEVRGEVERHIRGLGQRYFAAYAPPQIARHIEAAVRSKRDGLVVDAVPDPTTGTTELIVCTRDRSGVFNAIAGALSSQLINVIGAAAFTAPDGVVVDSFTVSDARNGTPLTQAQIERIEQTLHAVLIDGEQIGEYMDRARKKIFSLLQPKVPTRTRVRFDNDSSRTHTVIDIETGDRTGLLYDLSKMMSSADLDIASSRIVTDARRARDSFYVTRNGHKITDAGEQSDLESAILAAIHGEHAGTPAEAAT